MRVIPRPAPFQARVLDESEELKVKIHKLSDFVDTPAFRELPEAEQGLLGLQLCYMHLYDDALERRIAAFAPQA